jgi:hypothetical protein
MKSKRSPSPFAGAFKFGLGAGLGAGISTMVFILLGMAFFIPGVVLLSSEKKKDKKDQNDGKIIGAYVLMVLGAIIGLGMGASFIFSNIMEQDW